MFFPDLYPSFSKNRIRSKHPDPDLQPCFWIRKNRYYCWRGRLTERECHTHRGTPTGEMVVLSRRLGGLTWLAQLPLISILYLYIKLPIGPRFRWAIASQANKPSFTAPSFLHMSILLAKHTGRELKFYKQIKRLSLDAQVRKQRNTP